MVSLPEVVDSESNKSSLKASSSNFSRPMFCCFFVIITTQQNMRRSEFFPPLCDQRGQILVNIPKSQFVKGRKRRMRKTDLNITGLQQGKNRRSWNESRHLERGTLKNANHDNGTKNNKISIKRLRSSFAIQCPHLLVSIVIKCKGKKELQQKMNQAAVRHALHQYFAPQVDHREVTQLEFNLFSGSTSYMATMFNNPMMSDFKFVLKRSQALEDNEFNVYGTKKLNEIHVHKAVLSQSPIFKSVFESNMMEQLTNVMEINDADEPVDAFTAMIGLMYGSYKPIISNMDHLVEIMICLDKYQLYEYLERIVICVLQSIGGNFGVSNILWIWTLFDDDKSFVRQMELYIRNQVVNQVLTERQGDTNVESALNDFVAKVDHCVMRRFFSQLITPVCDMKKTSKLLIHWASFDESNDRNAYVAEFLSVIIGKNV